jgi:hypothetical protein
MTDTNWANGVVDKYPSSAEAVDSTLARVVIKIMISTIRKSEF